MTICKKLFSKTMDARLSSFHRKCPSTKIHQSGLTTNISYVDLLGFWYWKVPWFFAAKARQRFTPLGARKSTKQIWQLLLRNDITEYYASKPSKIQPMRPAKPQNPKEPQKRQFHRVPKINTKRGITQTTRNTFLYVSEGFSRQGVGHGNTFWQ